MALNMSWDTKHSYTYTHTHALTCTDLQEYSPSNLKKMSFFLRVTHFGGEMAGSSSLSVAVNLYFLYVKLLAIKLQLSEE